MAKTCNNCGTNEKKTPATVPYQVLVDFKETAKANGLKWFIICLILIVLLVGSNVGWLIYESQFEYIETTNETYEIAQDAEAGDNNSIINGGEIVNGKANN